MHATMAGANAMERAGRVIAKWKTSGSCINAEDLAEAAWRVAVGRKIAVHTTGVNLVRTHLIVEVEDEVWQRQLFTLRGLILRNIEKALGEGIVEDLEFRVGVRKIGPVREQHPWQAPRRKPSGRDEADRISDPVLKNIYKAARKRASA